MSMNAPLKNNALLFMDIWNDEKIILIFIFYFFIINFTSATKLFFCHNVNACNYMDNV